MTMPLHMLKASHYTLKAGRYRKVADAQLNASIKIGPVTTVGMTSILYKAPRPRIGVMR